MQIIHSSHPAGHAATTRVVAVFEAGTEFFELPGAATLGDLAARLRSLGDGDTLISVDVKVGSNRSTLHS